MCQIKNKKTVFNSYSHQILAHTHTERGRGGLYVFRLPDLWSDNLLSSRIVRRLSVVRLQFYLWINFSEILHTQTKAYFKRVFFLFLKIFIFDRMAAIFMPKSAFLTLCRHFSQKLFSNFFSNLAYKLLMISSNCSINLVWLESLEVGHFDHF